MRLIALFAIAAANTLGGLSYYWTRKATDLGLEPGTLNGVRTLIVIIMLGIWSAATTRFRFSFTRGEWARLVFIGVCALGAPLVLGVIGTQLSTPGNASILILVEPIAILFFSWVLLGEPLLLGDLVDVGNVPDLAGLFGQSGDQFRVGMTKRIHRDPGPEVEVSRPVLRDQPGAFAFHEGKGRAVIGGQDRRDHGRTP